ncbi:MAG: oxidoreductase [Mesoaciditoga sp.]|uniref:Gfo/Idh/MocA family protein n=2 Tax=Athalassotoga sp. TaxID=2022597 RepID=UPI000CC322EA|nr:MAG: oxidoreductase [Mesoaciditoga sp.]PMP79561.1 MAG: oxidoreductase [Mesoaciditoga sp.]
MAKIKVGVIGAGLIAQMAHIPAYIEAGAEVYGISDVVESRLTKVSERFSIPKVYPDYRDLISDPEIQAVSICTPNHFHARMTIDALMAGKSVLCEKPMAMNAGEAQKMLEVSQKTGNLLMMGFNNRFRGDAQKLKEFINEGKLGKIYHSKIGYIRRRGIPRGWFTVKREAGGGPVIDIGVHIIDLARYLMGNPKPLSVFAATYKYFDDYRIDGISPWESSDVKEGLRDGRENDVEDFAVAMIKFEDSTISLETSWASNIEEDRFYIDILGTEMGAKIDSYNPIHKGSKNNSGSLKLFGEELHSLVDYEVRVPEVRSHFEEIRYFVELVREKKPDHLKTANDGVEIQKIIDAIYESARTGKLVNL